MLLLLAALSLPVALAPALGYQVFSLSTPSMAPAVPAGSLVFVEYADPKDAREGDVVAYRPLPDEGVAADAASAAAEAAGARTPGAAEAPGVAGASGGAGVSGVAGASGVAGVSDGAGTSRAASASSASGAASAPSVTDAPSASDVPDVVVVHRVVDNDVVEGKLTTKGDANDTPDARPVPYARCVGVMRASVPALGTLVALYGNTAGKVYAVMFAAAAILMFALATRLRKIANEAAGATGP